MNKIDRIVFRFIRRNWIAPKHRNPHLRDGLAYYEQGTLQGQSLCITVANRQLFKATFRPFLKFLTNSHK